MILLNEEKLRKIVFICWDISYIMFLFPQSVCKSINRSAFLKKYIWVILFLKKQSFFICDWYNAHHNLR